MNKCVFCKIVKNEIPTDKIYEDEKFFAFLDINPVNPGHILVVPKIIMKNIYSLPDEILCDIGSVIKNSRRRQKSVNADGINIIMNNDRAAGQIVPHAHFHIIPRFCRRIAVIGPGKPYSNKEEVAKIAEKIKKELGL